MTSILLKGGIVLEHQKDDHIIPLPNTDVLIKDNKIVQIDKDIEPPKGAEVVDCSNKIISPGMIDTHNHIWMTQLKARHADHTLLDYIYSGGLQSFNFEPRDIYWGQLGGCLESIDAGTTTVVDHAHMTNSPEHVTEAIAATAHSGIRSIYCYSLMVRYKSWYPLVPYPDILPTWAFEQLESLANSQPFGDGRVSLGFGFDMWFLPKDRIIQIWDKARSLGIKLFTTHYCKNRIFGLQSVPELLRDYGLLKSDIIIGHGTQASASDAKILSDANIYVAAAPEVEGHLSLGQPLSFRGDVRVTLGADGHFIGPADIMSQMRSALLQARQCRNQKILDQNKFPRHNIGSSEQAFNMGTIEGEGAEFLAAHVVFSRDHPEAGRAEYLAGLQAKLQVPDYMRPAIIVALDQLPVTVHSKFDRAAVKALPLDEPSFTELDLANGREMTPVEAKLEELWRSVLPFTPTTAITPESNFFHVGGSSLLLVKLHRLIKERFSAAPKLVELMNAGKLSDMTAIIEATLSTKIDWAAETAVPDTWSEEFPMPLVKTSPRVLGTGLNVLLTGATGYLGRHLVPALVQSVQIAKVFCLVRRESDVDSLRKASEKIVIYTGDLGEIDLGLSKDEFSQLSRDSDIILHSGANRSFWDDYEVLRPANTNSIKELARLALSRRIPFHFISSGSVRIYGDKEGPKIYNIDQSLPSSPTLPNDGSDGYVASKWAAERFLRAVASQLQLPVTIHKPMPVPGYGPDDSHAEPESDHMVNQLVDITKRLQVRPTMEGLQGWADIMDTQSVVNDILDSILPEQGVELQEVLHTAVRRINWQRFIAELHNNPELTCLPSKDTLLWIGQAKRSGYSYFMPAHRLVVINDEDDMVSRR